MSEFLSSTAPVQNLLLRALPKKELERIRPHLRDVALPAKIILLMPNEQPSSVYFVQSGTVSMILRLQNGEQIEVGLVGREGMVGLSVLLNAPTSPLEGLIQVSGSALSIPAPAFRTLLAETPSLLTVLLRYVDGFHFQVAQSAACNSHHQIEQRLARWILMTHDRVEGDDFTMTHEFMSYMLGVHRPGVTLAVGVLQSAGLIQHSRSSMKVLDRAGLEAFACECYAVVQDRLAWLTQPVNDG